jgi:ribulose-phosphate 3-epimerase
MIISPSILSANFLNLESDIAALNQIKDITLHLDIMDGHFVPNLTFGHGLIKAIAKINKHPMDAHLMVTNPEFYIDYFADLGIANLTFHWEAEKNALTLIKKIKTKYKSAGISIKPETNLSQVDQKILKEIDLLLIMSVSPGFGGQKFIPNAVQKIQEACELRKKLGAHFTIQVDGGINQDNAQMLFQAGADNLVAGSAIFSGNPQDYQKNVDKLRRYP